MKGALALANRYRELKAVHPNVVKSVAAAVKASVEQEFNQGRDLYGVAWPAKKAGGASHLTQSAALRGSVDVKVTADSVAVSTSRANSKGFPIGIAHQGGANAGKRRAKGKRKAKRASKDASTMPERRILSIGIHPAVWREAIEDAFKDEMRACLG